MRIAATSLPLVFGVSLVTPTALAAEKPVPAAQSSTDRSSDAECLDQFLKGGEAKATPFIQASSQEEAIKKLNDYQCGKGASVRFATPNYGPCTLNPGAVYLRKEYDYKAAGNKHITTCTTPVTSITHAEEIHYKWYAWWKKAGGTTMSGGRNIAKLEQKNVVKTCKGTTNTTFIGSTLGTIVWKNKTYYARSYTKVAQLKRTM